ncbi:MAG: 4Fe-4S binding protein [Candidatus Hodarchaeaceae archaeon]|nr:4Fe-4S binding protein [Candidatus Hodarchaeaceae archaeon]
MSVKMLLKYSAEALDKPILAEVIRQTSAGINILHAELNATKGEMLIGVEGSPEEIERLIDLFKGRGVDARRLERTVELDEGSCMDCGACLSLCPTGALHITEDYSVKLNENKCIMCEVCVPACPVKAIKVFKPF